MKYYKVLDNRGKCVNGGKGKWYLPTKRKDGTWKPGKWMSEIDGELAACKNGYHLCRLNDLIRWLNEAIFEAEFEGEYITTDDKIIVRKSRLVRKIENWNEKTARLFACDCAEHVLHIFEKLYPDDKRPRSVIETARRFALGTATQDELRAAWDDACDAREVTRSAAFAAAEAAVRTAARNVWDATWVAAWAAGWDVEEAARAAEMDWQNRKLMKIIK